MTLKATLRRVTEADTEIVTELARALFTEAFAEKMASTHIDTYLNQAYTTEVIRVEILNSMNLFVLALVNEKPVGYLKLITSESARALEVDRLYLFKEYQGKGIGKQLMAFAEQNASGKGLESITLVVWEKNVSALEFYRYHGYIIQGKTIRNRGGETQVALCLKKPLTQRI